ncbi:MAG: alpha/beta hydrolase [Capsulimonadaceae bacterium]|nr:alpha/beta hydrolase [Capsulimonadaceae bacterium]
MMKPIAFAALLGCVLLSTSAIAQTTATPVSGTPVRLWDGPAPGAHGDTPFDIPTLTPFLPQPSADGAPSAAIVICPGGGYGGLSMEHEGTAYAQWLNIQGIAGFVLKYRLGSHGYHNPVEQEDADRAVRMVRANAALWRIDPKRVGIMGSSAGGHLSATVLTHNDGGDPNATDPIDRQSCRPDLGILCYPVITLAAPYAHVGSRNNLLGATPSADDITLLSAEQQVTAQTPPSFIWCTADDRAVPSMNSLLFAEALAKNKVPYVLHIYPHGPHGLGLGDDHPPFAKALPWAQELASWLQLSHFAAANTPVPLPASAAATPTQAAH